MPLAGHVGWQTHSTVASGLQDDWAELVSRLDSWARSAEPRGEDIAVTLGSGRVVQVVVTPDDVSMLRVACGPLSQVFRYVTERLGSMPDDCEFLVYAQYDLQPFTARHLPPATELPQFEGGRWFAYDPTGAVDTFHEPPAEDNL